MADTQAFHPRHCAIATSGGDHHVKIWALPAMPMPERRPVSTPRGYRPKIIHFPVFSTSRIHGGAADWIDW
jgi:polycomb protein EED